MLTKDLIRCRIVKGKAHPQFIDVESDELTQIADRLISIYRQTSRPVRSEIEEYAAPVINTARDVLLVKGLNKLLLDRSEFSHEEELNYCELRKSVFMASGKALKQKKDVVYAEYKDKIFANPEVDNGFLENGLYPDLPENEKLIKFKDLSAKKLLERYNCSLVQSLLINSKSITLIIGEKKAAKIRQMFKYLKFFRLLGMITREDDGGSKTKGKSGKVSRLRVVIDGPLSLFENIQKYGLQLALFFPTVCHLENWELEAEVKFRNRNAVIKLDQKSGLAGHYNNFGSYTPEEIKVFQSEFESKVNDWSITEETPFLPSGNQELIFPDLSFKNNDGKLIHLELFHRWHSTQLLARLKYGDANPDAPLLAGVDRCLYKRPEINDELNKSQWFTKNGFLFNDFPGVDRVYRCLEKLRVSIL